MQGHAAQTTLEAGFLLDRYELLARVAEGGFGQVWLARLRGKRGFEKLVAIKVPRLSGDVHFQGMLTDEARIASAIDHDNVAKIIELGEQDEILYIVMEWIDGEPLSTLLRALDKARTPFPIPIALRLVSDLCAAAHAAHELRGPDGSQLEVVHRDISPQNVLLPSSGSLKLIDFGIAKARDRASGDTTDGTLKGKVKYMAPEQAFGSKVDRRSDIFAIGAVLYRLLAGRAPYEADNEIATLHMLGRGEKPDPLPETIPQVVRDIVARAIELTPDARFATALEMQTALLAAMSTTPALFAGRPEVGAFVETHLRERTAKRRQAVESALAQAADRSISTPVSFPVSLSSRDLSGPSSERSVTSSRSGSLSHGPASQSNPSRSQSLGVLPAPATAVDILTERDPLHAPSIPEPVLPRARMRTIWGAAVLTGAIGITLIVSVVARDRAPSGATSAGSAMVSAAPAEAPPPPSASASADPLLAPSASASVASPSPPLSAPPVLTTAPPRASARPRPPPPVLRKPPKGAGTTDFGY